MTAIREESSIASLIASLPERERKTLIKRLSPQAAELLPYHWPIWARPKQRAPLGSWRFWLIQAGRGFGKTRAGAEWIRERLEDEKAPARRIALAGATAADVRDTMITGKSGVLSVFPPHQRPIYEPSKRRVTFHTGAIATCFSAEEPERFRGPEHDTAWADELAAWRYSDAWDQLNFGLRIGNDPRCIITTTPRPRAIVIKLVKDSACVVTRGSSYENRANLAEAWFTQILSKYEGTTLGRQELEGELFAEMPGALWTRAIIERTRAPKPLELRRIVVAIDPSASGSDEACECGLVVVGIDDNGHCFVLDDLSIRASPLIWATRAVNAYHEWKADRIVAETNHGADMIETLLRTVDKDIAYHQVRASKGKRARAEPISALYEKERVHHVRPFPDLEDQLCTYVEALATESPDRLDALVWGVTALTEGVSISVGVDPEANYRGDQWDV